MKKIILSALIALTAGCTALGFASCDNKKPAEPTATVDVLFPTVDGIKFVTDDVVDGKIEKGATLTFTLDLSKWEGAKNLTLYVGDEVLTPNENGEYSLTVNENTTVRFGDVTITFNETPGVEYVSEYEETITVPFNTQLNFSLDIDPFYTDESALVRAGTRIMEPNKDGSYTVAATSDMQISVLDVVKEQPTVTTGGTSNEEPFMIYSPADWVFIAEQVKIGNTNYVNGYYQLAADLDFKGRTIPVIGDATKVGVDQVETYFGGYFNGEGYTIKNFKIEENDTPYVGLFGYAMGSLEDANLGTIVNLHLKDFSVSGVMSGSASQMLSVGGLIGYGIGVNVINCSISGGTISATGNEMYLSYVGGAVGVLQSAFVDMGSNQSRVTAQLAYVSVKDTQVFANDGIIPNAGGLAGLVYAPEYLSTCTLINCYARDVMVYGAIQTGGVAGHISAYTSVFNCYSTGLVSAIAEIDDASMPEYSVAYAGGVVAYAENESAITRSFSAAYLSADAVLGSNYAFTGGIVAKTDAAGTYSPDAIEAVLVGNYYAEGGVSETVDFTSEEFLYNTLGWYDFDWIYEEGETYPSFYLNYEDTYTAGFETKFIFVNSTVGGNTYYQVNITEYAALSFAIISSEVSVSEYMSADNGAISYGFFFDEECTQRVPYSYLFTLLEQTIYIGFIDYSDVAGTYEMKVATGDTATLILNSDGSYEYEDGEITSGGIYLYNGSYITFNSARFARYANKGTINDLYQLDFYTFRGDIQSNGDLHIYDGTYFTKARPLVAISNFGIEGEYYFGEDTYALHKDWSATVNGLPTTYTLNGTAIAFANGTTGTYADGVLTIGGNTINAVDTFKGEWIISAAENYGISVDGKGNFTMSSAGETMSGTYELNANGTATLKVGTSTIGIMSIDEEGFLCLEGNGLSLSFNRADGYKGTWTANHANGTALLTLNGITVDGSGQGEIAYWDGNTYSLFYAMEYGRITLYNGAIVFGYMSYNAAQDTLVAYLYDSVNMLIDETNAYTFYHYDIFLGEWVGEHEDLGTVSFNGFGSYENMQFSGHLSINGASVPYTMDMDTMSGSFSYGDKVYTILHNVLDGTIAIIVDDSEKTYERKDTYAGYEIVDMNGGKYIFDGRGNLENGGVLTVNKNGATTEYNYKNSASGTIVSKNGAQIATITIENNLYVWKEGTTSTKLYRNNAFVGTWAVTGYYSQMLTLNPMDLTGKMIGSFNGRAVTAIYDEETGICTYGSEYLVPFENGDFAISVSSTLGTSYKVCTKADKLANTIWTQKLKFATTTFKFDGTGMSPNYSSSVTAVASRVEGSMSAPTTFTYEYLADYDVFRLYATINDVTRIYLIEFVEYTAGIEDTGAYVNTEKTMAFTMTSIDELYMIQAVEKVTGYTYTFNGRYLNDTTPGTVTATDKEGNVVASYYYVLTNRATTLGKIEMTLTHTETGAAYTAVFNMFDNPFSITLTAI